MLFHYDDAYLGCTQYILFVSMMVHSLDASFGCSNSGCKITKYFDYLYVPTSKFKTLICVIMLALLIFT